jgi:hypothetical protein
MDAWISSEAAPWFSFLSMTSLGAALSIFAKRGEHRGLVTAVWGAGALAGLVLLAAALAGAAMGQPWWVLLALGVPGVVLTPVYGWSVLTLDKAYAASEIRRTMAKDI